jgi:hypothetical protein
MSKIQWECDLVGRPFCEQLKAMGWQWIEGDTDVPELTERANFREVLLKERLAAALRKLNLRDDQPWLDDDRIRRIIEKLEKTEGHRLMEINESATKLLLKGTEIDGLRFPRRFRAPADGPKIQTGELDRCCFGPSKSESTVQVRVNCRLKEPLWKKEIRKL